ncbi:hypothetical protein [Paenibacillus sp. B1-33]|uniref:hypothetical protein n=1 Tax=unclassified Paenibacillus TaxID=185978 RepID=UPI003D2CD1C9
MPYEAKTNWKYDDTVTEKDLNRIEQGLKDAHVAEYKDITLQPGVQIIETENDTPFKLGSIKGRTLANLLGRNGRFVDLTKYLPDAVTAEKEGDYVKVTLDGSKERGTFRTPTRARVGEGASKYLLVGVVNAGTAKSAHIELSDEVNYAISSNPVTGTEDQIAFAIFDGSKTSRGMSVYLHILGSKDSYALFKDLRVFEISDEDAHQLSTFSSVEVGGRFPYVDSITNVVNPYLRCISGNMFPPAYEFKINGKGVFIDGIYSFYFEAEGEENKGIFYDLVVSPNKKYGIHTLCNNPKGNIRVEYYKDLSTAGNKNYFLISPTYHMSNNYSYIITPPNCSCVRVYLSNEQEGIIPLIGQFKFSDFVMYPFAEAHPFANQTQSMWAAECQLAADPVGTSNPDMLFIGDDGLPYVLEKWKKKTLDGFHLYERAPVKNKGFKTVMISDLAIDSDSPLDNDDCGKLFATKFDGNQLKVSDIPIVDWTDCDLVRINSSHLYLSISNEDSGWGDDYEPTVDEIKAYFLGWKMYDSLSNPPGDGVYNRTDGLNKAWGYRRQNGTYGGGTSVLPASNSPKVIDGTHGLYKLQYLKTKPTIVAISKYETGLNVSKGWNMVEVGSGVVIREKANVGADIYGNFYINHLNVSGTNLSHKTNKIMRVYQGGVGSSAWRVYADSRPNGKEYLYTLKENFDPTAVYYVTYTMLDSGLAVPISGSIAENLRGTVTNVAKWASDVDRRLSVVENQKAEKGVPSLIQLTPLNSYTGSTRYPDYLQGLFVRKDSAGYVWLYGLLSGGTPGTAISILPKGFRPKHSLTFAVPFYSERNADGSGGEATTRIKIAPNGGIFSNTPIQLSAEKGEWISLHLPPFLAE